MIIFNSEKHHVFLAYLLSASCLTPSLPNLHRNDDPAYAASLVDQTPLFYTLVSTRTILGSQSKVPFLESGSYDKSPDEQKGHF